MDTNKNLYTIIYSIILVVVVATLLALASSLLKDRQQRNIELDTKQQILKSVKLINNLKEQKDKNSYIEEVYSKHITDTTIVSANNELPLYICTTDSGDKKYIIPVNGAGLWGPIWGYIALNNDFNTIYGTTFDHKGETPGLGAEINTAEFSLHFENKEIFKDGKFVSILVVKGGADPTKNNEVDAISGGTITSKAVEDMLDKCISKYLDYFKDNLVVNREN